MLADGKADAAFMGGAIPIPAVVQLCSTQDVGFLTFDEAVVEKLKDYPFYSVVKDIPADTYSDLDQDLKAINVGNMQLITHANVDEDVVYHFTKIMYENRDKWPSVIRPPKPSIQECGSQHGHTFSPWCHQILQGGRYLANRMTGQVILQVGFASPANPDNRCWICRYQ